MFIIRFPLNLKSLEEKANSFVYKCAETLRFRFLWTSLFRIERN